jgi:hypothetical protein
MVDSTLTKNTNRKTGLVDLTSTDGKVFITGSDRSTAHIKIDRESLRKELDLGRRKLPGRRGGKW